MNECMQNGKGSTTLMMASILVQSGFKTGAFTSPHLIKEQDCIRIGKLENKQTERLDERLNEGLGMVNDTVYSTVRQKVELANIEIKATSFEVLTTCAFLAFSMEQVDIAVIEVKKENENLII